jgi:hypothetical protein
MEEHFLKEFVVNQEREEPRPWYNPAGDCIIYQTSDEAIVAEGIDELLTIYRSANANKAIGYQITGVQAIIRLFGLEEISVESKQPDGNCCHFRYCFSSWRLTRRDPDHWPAQCLRSRIWVHSCGKLTHFDSI